MSLDPVAWPIAELPFFAEHGTWTEGLENNVAEFPVEVGPPKTRRRTYLPSIKVQFQRIISTAHLDIFLDFYESDLLSGVRTFLATDPRTEESTEYQFVQPPSWRDVSPGYWKLQFSLRKINLPPAS